MKDYIILVIMLKVMPPFYWNFFKNDLIRMHIFFPISYRWLFQSIRILASISTIKQWNFSLMKQIHLQQVKNNFLHTCNHWMKHNRLSIGYTQAPWNVWFLRIQSYVIIFIELCCEFSVFLKSFYTSQTYSHSLWKTTEMVLILSLWLFNNKINNFVLTKFLFTKAGLCVCFRIFIWEFSIYE